MGEVLTLAEATETLPQMLADAERAVTAARSSAELLEAKDKAGAAYDLAARFTRRKQAFDTVTATAMRLQAQALRIEARAKERLADEYDAAQERGEVKRNGGDRTVEVPNSADLGLRRDEIHEARRLRDAEAADPGMIDRTIDGAVARGEAPTRAHLRREVKARTHGGDDPVAGNGADGKSLLKIDDMPSREVAEGAGAADDIELTDEDYDKGVVVIVGVLSIIGEWPEGFGMPGSPNFVPMVRAIARGGWRRDPEVRQNLEAGLEFLTAVKKEMDRHG